MHKDHERPSHADEYRSTPWNGAPTASEPGSFPVPRFPRTSLLPPATPPFLTPQRGAKPSPISQTRIAISIHISRIRASLPTSTFAARLLGRRVSIASGIIAPAIAPITWRRTRRRFRMRIGSFEVLGFMKLRVE